MSTVFAIHSPGKADILYLMMNELTDKGLKSTDWNRRYTIKDSKRIPKHIAVRNGCAFFFLVEPSFCDVHMDLTEDNYNAILQEILDNQ